MKDQGQKGPRPAKIHRHSHRLLQYLAVIRGKTMLDTLDEIITEEWQRSGIVLNQEMQKELDQLRADAAARWAYGLVNPPELGPPLNQKGSQPDDGQKKKRGRPRKYDK